MDLSKYSKDRLIALKATIDKRLVEIEEERKSEAQEELRSVAKKYGIPLKDLMTGALKEPSKSKAVSKSKPPAKYKHPHKASWTWSGRGRPPAWFKEYTDAGGNPDDLLIAA